MMDMTDEQLLRYSRHILLDEIGVAGQAAILSGHVLVVGAGGLGCAAGLYLASAGVGRMTLVDHDVVDTTNLQRQIAHTTDRVGLLKVDSLRQAIGHINPHVHVQAIAQKMTLPSLLALASQADVVLDCTDNFATRHAINQACVQHGKPLVSGAAMRFDGQLAVYHPAASVGAPCYACVFPLHQGANEAQCATMGVFAPLVGIVGSMQAAEALKLLVGMPSHLLGRLCMFNGLSLQTTTIGVAKQPDCKVCQVPRQSKDSC